MQRHEDENELNISKYPKMSVKLANVFCKGDDDDSDGGHINDLDFKMISKSERYHIYRWQLADGGSSLCSVTVLWTE